MELKMHLPTTDPLQALAAWFARALARRRARHQALQLAAMSEHELLDLGIGRSEVSGAAARPQRQALVVMFQ